MKKPLNWFPLWIDSWLFGSTRIELTLEQRAIWVDFLALAGKDQGFIRANEQVPYPPTQLAGLLGLQEIILTAAIDRFLETGKLERKPNGTLYIANWEVYRLTPQYRRRLKPPSPLPLPQSKVEKSRVEESKGEGNHVSPSRNIDSQKGNKETEKDDLPPIPKQAPFKIKDDLKEIRHKICDLKRSLDDEKEMRKQIEIGYYENIEDAKRNISQKIEKKKARYRELFQDYRDD